MESDISVSSVDEVMVCQAREGQVASSSVSASFSVSSSSIGSFTFSLVQVFVGRKPHYLETVLDSTVVDVQQLNTSDWSTTDDEGIQKDPIGNLILFSFSF